MEPQLAALMEIILSQKTFVEELKNETDNKITTISDKVHSEIANLESRFKSLEKLLARLIDVSSVTGSKIKLPTFDGQNSWKTYQTQFEVISEANKWREQTKAYQLAASLRGVAAEILQTLPKGEHLDYEKLTKALEIRFGEDHLKEYYRIQLKGRYQKEDESLQELAADVEKLAKLVFSDYPPDVRDYFAMQHFIDALKDQDIQNLTRLADCKDFRSALLYAMKVEAINQTSAATHYPVRAIRTRKERPKNYDNENNSREGKSRKQMDEEEITEIVKRVMKQRRRQNEIICFNCNKKGHIQYNCRYVPKANETQVIKRKHYVSDEDTCEETEPRNEFQVSSLRSQNSGLYIAGHLNNMSTEFAIDTGANVTVIRRDVARQVSTKLLYTSPVHLCTATGEKVIVNEKVNVKIRIGSNIFTHSAYASDISDKCIIGLDFLRKYDITLNLKYNKVCIGREEIPLHEMKDTDFTSYMITEDLKMTVQCKNLSKRNLNDSNSSKEANSNTDVVPKSNHYKRKPLKMEKRYVPQENKSNHEVMRITSNDKFPEPLSEKLVKVKTEECSDQKEIKVSCGHFNQYSNATTTSFNENVRKLQELLKEVHLFVYEKPADVIEQQKPCHDLKATKPYFKEDYYIWRNNSKQERGLYQKLLKELHIMCKGLNDVIMKMYKFQKTKSTAVYITGNATRSVSAASHTAF